MDGNILGINIRDGVSYVEVDCFSPEYLKEWSKGDVKISGRSLYEEELKGEKLFRKLYIVTDKTNLDVFGIPPMKPIKPGSLIYYTDPEESQKLCDSNKAEILPNKELQETIAGLCDINKNGAEITIWGTLEYHPRKKDTQFSIFPEDIEIVFENIKKSA